MSFVYKNIRYLIRKQHRLKLTEPEQGEGSKVKKLADHYYSIELAVIYVCLHLHGRVFANTFFIVEMSRIKKYLIINANLFGTMFHKVKYTNNCDAFV